MNKKTIGIIIIKPNLLKGINQLMTCTKHFLCYASIMKHFLVLLLLITFTVLNPYENLNYDEINAYYYTDDCWDSCISYYESDYVEPPEEPKYQYNSINVGGLDISWTTETI